MKKASLLPAVIVGCMGVAFAAISMFPDTSDFPQRPAGAGTIAGFFDSFFNSDGTAKNAARLDGLVASGYLQDNDCTNPINKVWVGVDDNGKGKCGSVNSSLLGYISDFSGTTVELWDGSNWNPVADVGGTIKVGDFIRTGNDSLVTVVFSDNSVLRLNTDSKVDFQLGTNDTGDTIAQLILGYGEIWGRVMTSTGMNFGNDDWIAGVRGTALTMDYKNIGTAAVPIWTGSINIIDSTNMVAAVVESTVDSNVKTTLAAGEKIAIKEPDTLVSYSKTMLGDEQFASVSSVIDEIEAPSVKTAVVRTTSLTSPWVRENIKKDLVHLANLTNSGTVAPTIKSRAKQEFFTSVPKTMLECTNTLFGKVVKHDKSGKQAIKSKRAKFVSVNTTLNALDFCTPLVNAVQSAASDEVKINTAACALGSMKFFGGSDPEGYCEEKGLVAVAEFNQASSIATTLGMYRVDGYNLFHSQSSMDSLIANGKYVPWFDTSNSPQFKDGNALGQPPNATKLTLLNANGLKFQSGSLEHGIFTMTNLDNAQGAMINNEGADSYIKYNLPTNINKIDITVRGAALVRHHVGIKHYLFGIHDGYELYVYYDGTHNKLKLVGFGKNIELTVPTGVMADQSKLFTIVFKKDAGSDGTLSLLNNDGQLVSSVYGNPVTGDIGTTYSFLKGNQPYIYIGTDGNEQNAINDIIDSVRLYNE